MKHVIAQDHRDRPTKSVLVWGPEVSPKNVVGAFYQAKASRKHPVPLEWLILHDDERGVEARSFIEIKPEPKSKKV